MYIPPLAKVWQHCRVFHSVLRSYLLADYCKTTMCWLHHFPDSPEDEKDAVFCSRYTLVSPSFYFCHRYSIPVSFFPFKPDFFYFKCSSTTVRAKKLIKYAYGLYYPEHSCFIQDLDNKHFLIQSSIWKLHTYFKWDLKLFKCTTKHQRLLPNSGPFDNSMYLNQLKP